jgi:hypothetical protein
MVLEHTGRHAPYNSVGKLLKEREGKGIIKRACGELRKIVSKLYGNKRRRPISVGTK